MKALILHSHAVFISTHRSHLKVVDYINRTETEFAPHEIPYDLIVIFNAGGNVSFEAVRWLSEHGVSIAHVNWDGKLIAQTLCPGPISGKLRLAQYRAYLDPKRRHEIASAFVETKVERSLDLLRFLRRFYPDVDVEAVLKETGTKTTHRPGNIRASIMTREARIAEAYWHEYAKVVNQLSPEFGFVSRQQSGVGGHNMSAGDPTNASLNYLYGVLEATMRVAIQKAGLDQDIGFLHEAQPGANPLVYDFMELFRWVCDLTLIEMLQRKKLRIENFTVKTDYRRWLRTDSASSLTQRLVENLNRKVKSGAGEMQLGTLLDNQVRTLVRCIESSSKGIAFIVPFSADVNYVDDAFKEKVLKLTPDERRLLGLRKNTIHYIKKNIAKNRPIRVYQKVRVKLLD